MNEQPKAPNREEQRKNIKTLKDKAQAYRADRLESELTNKLYKLLKSQERTQKSINLIEQKYKALGGTDIHESKFEEATDYIGVKKIVRNHLKPDQETQMNQYKAEYRHLAKIWHETEEFLNQDYKKLTFDKQQVGYIEDFRDLLKRKFTDPKPLEKEAENLILKIEGYHQTRHKARQMANFGTNNVIESVLNVPVGITESERVEYVVMPESTVEPRTEPIIEATATVVIAESPAESLEVTTTEVPSQATPENQSTNANVDLGIDTGLPIVVSAETENIEANPEVTKGGIIEGQANILKEEMEGVGEHEMNTIRNNLKTLSTALLPGKTASRIIGFTDTTVTYKDQYGKTYTADYKYDITEKDNTRKYLESKEYIEACENFQGFENKQKFSQLLTVMIQERKEDPTIKEYINGVDNIKGIDSITEPVPNTFYIKFCSHSNQRQFIKISIEAGKSIKEVEELKKLVKISKILPLSELQLQSEEYLVQKVELGSKLEMASKKYEDLNRKEVTKLKSFIDKRLANSLKGLDEESKNKIKPIIDLAGITSTDNSVPKNFDELFELNPRELNFTTDQEIITYIDKLAKDSAEILSTLNTQLLMIKEIKWYLYGESNKKNEIIDQLEERLLDHSKVIESKNTQLQEALAYSQEAYSTHILGYVEPLENPLQWIDQNSKHISFDWGKNDVKRDLGYIKGSTEKVNLELVDYFEEKKIEPYERKYTYSQKVQDNIESLVGEDLIGGSKLIDQEVIEYKAIQKILSLNQKKETIKDILNKVSQEELKTFWEIVEIDSELWSDENKELIYRIDNILEPIKKAEWITEEDIANYEKDSTTQRLTKDQERLMKKVKELRKEVKRIEKNPKTEERWLTKAKQQLENLRVGNEAEKKIFEAVSKQEGVFGVLELPKWSKADMDNVDCLILKVKNQPTEKDSQRFVELLSKSTLLSYKDSLEKIKGIGTGSSNSDKIRGIGNNLTTEEKNKKYLGDPKDQIKVYQEGKQTNSEMLDTLDKATGDWITAKETTEFKLMLIEYGIEFIPCQIKNVIGKTIRGEEEESKKDKTKVLTIGYTPTNLLDSPYIIPTGKRPDDLPAINPELQKEPDISYSINLEDSVAMALGLNNPIETYNQPGINTQNRFNHKDIELEDGLEHKRDLIDIVKKILTN